MDNIKIPKFANETDETNWAYEHREERSAAFHQAVQEGQVRQGTLKRRTRVEAELLDASQSKELVVNADEMNGSSVASVLLEKLRSK